MAKRTVTQVAENNDSAVDPSDTNDAPKIGSAEYDWAAHYDNADTFRYEFADGSVIEIRTFDSIYSKTWLYKVQSMVDAGATDVDVEFAAINRAACPVAQELLMSLDDSVGDPIDDLWQAWVISGTKPAATASDSDALSVGKSPG